MKKVFLKPLLLFASLLESSSFASSEPQDTGGSSPIRFQDSFNIYKNRDSGEWYPGSSSQDFATLNEQKMPERPRQPKIISNYLHFPPSFGESVAASNMISESNYLPVVSLNETGPNIYYDNLDRKSRFFSIDSSSQSLNLGVSFSIPFISIPTQALLSLGQTTTTMLTELISVNLPSVAMAAIMIGAVMLIIPKIMSVLLSFLSQYGIPGALKFGQGTRGEDGGSSYSNYMRSLEVAPFTAILSQIEDAMKEYNLDSTSCMQRVVCSYISESEQAVDKGRGDPLHYLIKGITGTPWLLDLLGENALTEALQIGSINGISCSQKFPKCPFSLRGILKLLTTFASTINR